MSTACRTIFLCHLFLLQTKCAQYWSDTVSEPYNAGNGFIVTLLEVSTFVEYEVKTFSLGLVSHFKLGVMTRQYTYYSTTSAGLSAPRAYASSHCTYVAPIPHPQESGAGSHLHIHHFQFTAWPDHGVPRYPASVIKFVQTVQHHYDKDGQAPMVVHCRWALHASVHVHVL